MTSWPKDVNGYPIVHGKISVEIQDGLVVPDGDLTVSVAPMNYDIGNTIGRYLGAINQAVTNDATNYVYLSSVGSLVVNTSGYPSGVSHIRLARVVTEGGVITRYYDDRSLLTGASVGGGGGSGEANTASNVGVGVGVFAQKNGVDLEFKTFVQGSGIVLSSDGTTITIAASTAPGDVTGPVASADNALARFDGVTGKVLQNSVVALDDVGSLGPVQALSHNLLAEVSRPAHAEGLTFYDAKHHTLAVYNDQSDIIHQLGQEGLTRVYNNTGATILNGAVVTISGVEGAEFGPTIALANASSKTLSRVAGLATHDIPADTFGYITYWGVAHELNTSNFVAGDPLYLSATAPGTLTKTEPPQGSYAVLIGYALRIHASLGSVLVTTNTSLVNGVGESTRVTLSVAKASGGAIAKGQVVYIAGYNPTLDVPTVELARADASGTMPVAGVALDTIDLTTPGRVVIKGRLGGLNTSSFSVGDSLYTSAASAGALTNVRPTGTALVQAVARVAHSDAAAGVIIISGAGRTNDLPNLAQNFLWTGDGNGVPTAISRSGSDSSAFHNATAGELNALTVKVTPVSADVLVIEDSANGFAKRKVTIGSLPSGGGGEANTITNVGGGVGVYKQKSGVNFELRTLAATSPLTVALNGADVIQLGLGVINDTIHGPRGGGSQHAVATSGSAGFLSAADKAKLDLFAAASEYIRRNGTVAFTGNQSFGNFDARNIRSATYASEIVVGPASGAASIVWTLGQKQSLTLQGDTTLSFTNPPGPCNLILRVLQDINGGWNITWPASVHWSKGLSPSLTVLGGSVDLLTFYYNNGVYYGGFLGDFQVG